MVLSRLTKITGPGVATDTNWVGNNADFTGITTTATSFNIGVTTIHSNLIEAHNIKSTGIITATGGSFSGNVTAVDGTFTGNVSIAGTLTYEDVTNVDSVGIVTAAAVDVDDFVSVGSNIHLGNAGVVTATSFVGSGAALTGIDATAIKDSGGNVKVQAQASGAIHTGVSTFQDIDVDGHTNLDNVSIAGLSTHSEGIFIPDDKSIRIGNTFANPDLKIASSSSSEQVVIDYARSGTGKHLRFRCTDLMFENYNGLTKIARFQGGVGVGHAELYYAGNKKFETTTKGIQVGTGVTIETNGQATFTGIVTASTYYGDGSNLSNITSTTINNNANNRIITGSGTANTLEGEANLTFDGTTLTNENGGGAANLVLKATSNSFNSLILDSNRSADTQFAVIDGRWNGTTVNRIQFVTGSDGTNKDDGYMAFHTRTSGASLGERLRITSAGDLALGHTSAARGPLHIHRAASDCYFHMTNSTTGTGSGDGFTIHQGGVDTIINNREAGPMRLYTSGTERLRIDSSGHLHTGYTSSFGNDHINILASDGGGIAIASNNVGNATTGDILGSLSFQGYLSGAGYGSAEARISAIVSANHTGSSAATDMVFYTKPSSTGPGSAPTERARIASDGKMGLGVTDPKSLLHLGSTGDIRFGSQYGGFAHINQQVQYAAGYTGTHWMFESNNMISWCFDGVLIVYGGGGSSYGSEVTKITIVYSRENGANNSGDMWRNGTTSYNIETLGHAQVGLNPGAGSLTTSEDTAPDGAASQRSLFKLGWTTSGHGGATTTWSKLHGTMYWGQGVGYGSVEVQDKDGNIFWNSNP